MRYDFLCIKHGWEERNVPLADRDNQKCHCGEYMTRAIPAKGVGIFVPKAFSYDPDVKPMTEAEEKEFKAHAVPRGSRWI